MHLLFTRSKLAAAPVAAIVALTWLCLAGAAFAQAGGSVYKGRVLYRANKGPVPGVLVEIVRAEDDGKPTDEVLGSAHADAEGRFAVALEKPGRGPVALVVSAVRESAASGGDRRGAGYEVQTHRIQLGYLPNPSPTKGNTILIERRRPGRGSGDSDND